MVMQYQHLLMFGLDLQALRVLQVLAQVVVQVLTLALPHIQTDLLLLPNQEEFLELVEP